MLDTEQQLRRLGAAGAEQAGDADDLADADLRSKGLTLPRLP
jgi:hypothetical protein